MTLYSSKAQKSEIAFAEAMKQAGIEVILTDFQWGEWECMVNTTEHDKLIRNKTIEDVEKLLNKIAPDKVAEIKCDDGEIRNRPLIDIARVYEILEQMKEGAENG